MHRDPRNLHSFPTRRSSDLSCSSGPRPVSIATADQGTLPGRSGFESAVAFEVVVVLELRTLADVVEDRAEHADRHAVEYLRSEEHTSELQSRLHLVCRLLLE